jgi:hypothetical protein
MEGSCVGDVVQVTGAVTDPHLVGYTVSYATGVMSDWIQVASYQVQGNVDGALATWVMLGMPEGFYRVMVAAVDSVGNAANATVSVKRVAANLSLFVSDITFSDPRPEAGDEVTVYVTVHNDGTAGVEGVTLIVMMNGMEILRDKFVMVPAHGRYVAEVRVKAASERMTFAARATSQTHDTGEMVQGAVLVPSEETELSGIASNALVVVALVVAIMAVILAIYLGMRGRRPQEGRV